MSEEGPRADAEAPPSGPRANTVAWPTRHRVHAVPVQGSERHVKEKESSQRQTPLAFFPFAIRSFPAPAQTTRFTTRSHVAGAAMALAFLLGFLLGALALAALEAAAALILVRRLRRKQAAAADAPPADELPGERPFPYEKQVE